MMCTNYGHYEIYDQKGCIEGNTTFLKGGIDIGKEQKKGKHPQSNGTRMFKIHSEINEEINTDEVHFI